MTRLRCFLWGHRPELMERSSAAAGSIREYWSCRCGWSGSRLVSAILAGFRPWPADDGNAAAVGGLLVVVAMAGIVVAMVLAGLEAAR